MAERTGLSPSVLRAWERRYGVVTPERSGGRQRIYSEADIERLLLLKRAREGGWSIGQAATLSNEDLESLLRTGPPVVGRPGGPRESPAEPTAPLVRLVEDQIILADATAAVEHLDAHVLERHLMRAAVLLPPWEVVDRIVLPLLVRVGELWRGGVVRPANEHLASEVIRRFLEWLTTTIDVAGDAPLLLCGTPSGQRHELGALASGVTAATAGWKPVFVGPDLPARDIAFAAQRLGAAAVALSVVRPPLGSVGLGELETLEDLLPSSVPLIVGGPAVLAHRETLEGMGIEVLTSMSQLRARLLAALGERRAS